MNRLSSVLRTALLADGADAIGGSGSHQKCKAILHRWSMGELAHLNDTTVTDTKDSVATAAPNAADSPTKSFPWKRRTRYPQSSRVAQTLVSQVKLRLARQHSRCLQLLDLVPSYHNDNNTNTARRVVGASMKNEAKGNNKQVEHDKIIKSLEMLEAVHADTYRLVHQLLYVHGENLSFNPETKQDDWSPNPLWKRFDSTDQKRIASILEQVRNRHATTVENLVDAILPWRSLYPWQHHDDTDSGHKKNVNDLVEEFNRHRLLTQLLCDHYVVMYKGRRRAGTIDLESSLSDAIDNAITEATHICDANLGMAPPVSTTIVTTRDETEEWLNVLGISKWDTAPNGALQPITIIQPWLHYVLVELLKNAMASSVRRAQAETAERESSSSTVSSHSDPSMVYIVIFTGSPDSYNNNNNNQKRSGATCWILDQGTGLSEAVQPFQFATTGASRRWDRLDEQQTYAMVRSPLGSLGVGLTLSRHMMRIMGGDVRLKNRTTTATEPVLLNTGCTAVVDLPADDSIVMAE